MTAPGPDGKVCGYGCDKWSISSDCPTHFGQSAYKPGEVTRPKRMALDTAREYYRLSREAYGRSDAMDAATVFALQGILRLMIYQVGGDQDGGYV